MVAQRVKNPPAVQETWVQPLGQEDPLEKGMATPSSIFSWPVPWTEEPSGFQSMGSQRVRHSWAPDTFTSHITEPPQAEKGHGPDVWMPRLNSATRFQAGRCCVNTGPSSWVAGSTPSQPRKIWMSRPFSSMCTVWGQKESPPPSGQRP